MRISALIPSIAIGIAAALAPPAAAQAVDDPLPRDVVTAILRHYDGPGDVDILVGAMPADLVQRVSLPRGAHVIATLIGADRQVIGTVRGQSDSVRLWFASEFEGRGFEPVSSSGRDRPAFRPAERSPSMSGYCANGEHFSVAARNRTGGMVEFSLRVRRTTVCEPAPDQYRFGVTSSGGGAPALPLLYHPRGAELTRECANASFSRGAERSTQAFVSSSTVPVELLAYYGRQLDSLGWRRDTAGAALGVWAMRDSTGRDVRLELAIGPGAGSSECLTLEMSVFDLRRW